MREREREGDRERQRERGADYRIRLTEVSTERNAARLRKVTLEWFTSTPIIQGRVRKGDRCF